MWLETPIVWLWDTRGMAAGSHVMAWNNNMVVLETHIVMIAVDTKLTALTSI